MKKILISITILIFSCISAFTYDYGFGIGADAAAPKIEKVLKTIKIPQNKLYLCTDKDVELIIDTAAKTQINIFELIDCVYRYLAKNNMRIEVKGSSLRKLMNSYDYGGTRVLGIIPIPVINKFLLGVKLNKDDKPFQVYLTKKYKKYIEIGTALYEKEFGFNKMKANWLLDAYGMKVKKFGLKLTIKSINLYTRGYGAIHLKGIPRPKLWDFALITKKQKSKDTDKDKSGKK